jgi:hypothetical protein
MSQTDNTKNYAFSKFPLYANETPVFRKQPNMLYVPYGKNNDYSDYLSYLYNNSGIHGAIIKGKATYIFGKGFKIRADWNGDKVALQKTLNSINSSQTADELARKKIFERTLYGGCAYLIEWDVFGNIKSVKLQPFNTIRTNVEKSEFYISKEWTREQSTNAKWKRSNGKLPEDTVTLPAFDPLKRQGKQILYLIDDNPASDIYPLPEYNSGATPIETDIECNFFQLNNVKTGFSAGTMVTFFNGTAINDEEQVEIEHAFKSKASGTDNAGEILLNFQNPNTTAPVISPLRSNELDKQYEQLSKDTINKILYSHRVSNGLLFGIKTPGELGGGRSEFDLSWEHFSNTYVKPKQQEEEEDMNYILSLYGFMGNPVELTTLDPIGIELTSDVISRTIDADSFADMVYERLGIEKPNLVKKDDILTTINSASPLVANKILDSLTTNEIRSIINLPAIVGGDTTRSSTPSAFSQEEDFILNKFLEIGEPAENYEIVKQCFVYSDADKFAVEDDQRLLDEIKKGKAYKISDLAKKLKISESEVYKSLERLNKANILQVKYTESNGEISITPEEIQEPPTQEVGLETKWRYTTNLTPAIIDGTRKFCRDLLTADLLYSRAQIDNMQNVASTKGYNDDVFKYKGGWQTIKGTVTHIPSCRHFWESVLVRKK